MSFGFSPNDIIGLITLTSRTYKGWRDACSDYADITGTLDCLYLLLRRLETHVPAQTSSEPGFAEKEALRRDLATVIRGVRNTVDELDRLLDKFPSLSKSRSRNWERIKFGAKDLSVLRSRLTQHVSSISAFLNVVELESIGRLGQDVNAMPDIISQRVTIALGNFIDARDADNRSMRGGTVMTSYSNDDIDVWRQFRSECVRSGIKSNDIKKFEPELKRFFQSIITEKQTAAAKIAAMEEKDQDKDSSQFEKHKTYSVLAENSSRQHATTQDASPAIKDLYDSTSKGGYYYERRVLTPKNREEPPIVRSDDTYNPNLAAAEPIIPASEGGAALAALFESDKGERRERRAAVENEETKGRLRQDKLDDSSLPSTPYIEPAGAGMAALAGLYAKSKLRQSNIDDYAVTPSAPPGPSQEEDYFYGRRVIERDLRDRPHSREHNSYDRRNNNQSQDSSSDYDTDDSYEYVKRKRSSQNFEPSLRELVPVGAAAGEIIRRHRKSQGQAAEGSYKKNLATKQAKPDVTAMQNASHMEDERQPIQQTQSSSDPYHVEPSQQLGQPPDEDVVKAQIPHSSTPASSDAKNDIASLNTSAIPLNDLQTTMPFQSIQGLTNDSLNDLVSSLPFQSRPVDDTQEQSADVVIPSAPKPPATPDLTRGIYADPEVWETYALAFADYVTAFQLYDATMLRYTAMRKRVFSGQGDGGKLSAGTLEAALRLACKGTHWSSSYDRVHEYFQGIMEDSLNHESWTLAWEEHVNALGTFMRVKDRLGSQFEMDLYE